MLTQERIQNLFRLSALKAEVIDSQSSLKSLNEVLDYMAELEKVDTTGVDMSHVTSPLRTRPDEIVVTDRSSGDNLLKTSPQRVIAHQIALPSII